MDILSEMSSVYYELTTSEKRIAEYILDHTDEVQMMSISELAEACHVGEAYPLLQTVSLAWIHGIEN